MALKRNRPGDRNGYIYRKNIPDELYEQLKQIAKANQRSINGEIIYATRRAVTMQPIDVDEWLKHTCLIRDRTEERWFVVCCDSLA